MKFEKIYEFKAASDGVSKIAIVNNFLFTGDKEDFLRKWNMANFSKISEVKAHDKNITAFTFSPDFKTLISASEDGSIKEFDLFLNHVRDYQSHAARVNEICFRDLNSFITASDDGLVRIYRKGQTSKIAENDLDAGDIEAISIFKNNIIAGGSVLVVCDLNLKPILRDEHDYIYGINGIYVHNNTIYISRSMEKKLEIRNENFEVVKVLKMRSWINDIKFKNDFIFIALGDVIEVFDNSLNKLAENDFSSAEVLTLDFYGDIIVAGYDDGYIRTWKLSS